MKREDWITGVVDKVDQSYYPKKGSTGVYIPKLTEKLIELNSSKATSIFFILASGMNEYSQFIRPRKDIAKVLGIEYNAGNIGMYIKKLVDLEMVGIIGKTITVNPFLIMPTVKMPQLKYALQEMWIDVVEYGDDNDT